LPHQVPLQAVDPGRVGRYRLTGRLDGIPSDDPIFTAFGPDGTEVCVTVLGGYWDAAALDRFAAEAAAAKRVPPFCAARVLDAGLDGNEAFLVSEYVPGRSLLELVAEFGVATGPQLEALAIGMATGLASVHQAGLVHGSFGPQYVVLAENGPPHIVEFGITPPYGSATPSADMLAWAQTVVFAATRKPPGEAVDLGILPESVREPVQQCLELDPSERPAARAVVQFLLGDRSLPAGVLAEGSRRAARGSNWSGPQVPAPARAAPAGPQSARHPAPPRTRPRPDSGGRPPGGASHPARASHGPAAARHTGGSPAAAAPGPAQARPAARPSGRRRAFPWLITGAGVVVVLAVILILHLTQGGTAANLSANTGQPGASGAAGPTASQGPAIPAPFIGTWTGRVGQPGQVTTYNVTLKLAAGQSVSTISYATGCLGNLTPTSVTKSQMVMKVSIVQDQQACGKAFSVTVTMEGPKALGFDGGQGGAATGMLQRQ